MAPTWAGTCRNRAAYRSSGSDPRTRPAHARPPADAQGTYTTLMLSDSACENRAFPELGALTIGSRSSKKVQVLGELELA